MSGDGYNNVGNNTALISGIALLAAIALAIFVAPLLPDPYGLITCGVLVLFVACPAFGVVFAYILTGPEVER